MPEPPPPLSPAYHALAALTRDLHRLFAAGAADSPEADEVRDATDGPWRAASDLDRGRIDGLSEDLYMITDPPHAARPMTQPARVGLATRARAESRGDWDLALGLLRAWGAYLTPAALAARRGVLWYNLGDPESAALFFEHAAELEGLEPVEATSA